MRSVQILQHGWMGPVMVAPTDGIIEGVPDIIAQDAVNIGLAVFADNGPTPEPDDETGLTVADLGQPAEEDSGPKRPWGNATKAAWIAYALEVDPNITRPELEAMSKNALMSEYGGRV